MNKIYKGQCLFFLGTVPFFLMDLLIQSSWKEGTLTVIGKKG